MSKSTRVGFIASAAALTLAGVAAAGDNDARIAALEAEVARLKGEGWLNEQRADEVRSIVQDVLADADTRTSLLQGGTSAGYDKGFVLGSSDGNFMLRMNGLLQVRYTWNNQDDSAGDTNRWGFENRRTRLKFSGHVVDPSWRYVIYGDFGSSGSLTLLDAYIQKKFDNGWAMTVGQFKTGFLREELVSASKQLTADRSLVNAEFGQGRSQGIKFSYSGDQFRGSFAATNGLRDTNGRAIDEDTELSLAGRVEMLAAGNWGQFSDFTSSRGSEYGALIGLGAFYERDEFGTVSMTDQTEQIGLTLDASIESDGWNFFVAGIYRQLDNDATDQDQYAFVVQGGYYFQDDLEGFLRYEYGDLDDDMDELSVITVGVNKYFAGHQVKWTTDVGYGLDAVNSNWASNSLGYRADGMDEDGQLVLRSQLQLTF